MSYEYEPSMIQLSVDEREHFISGVAVSLMLELLMGGIFSKERFDEIADQIVRAAPDLTSQHLGLRFLNQIYGLKRLQISQEKQLEKLREVLFPTKSLTEAVDEAEKRENDKG